MEQHGWHSNALALTRTPVWLAPLTGSERARREQAAMEVLQLFGYLWTFSPDVLLPSPLPR